MTWSCPAFEWVVALLGSRTGLVFLPGRRAGVELGIRRAMARAKIDDPERYRSLLGTNTSLFDDLIAELTVGETYFFREPGHFEFIRREVLSPLRDDRTTEKPIRVWSAGCATGEEAFSLAMLLEEEGFSKRTYLLATDLSREALFRARQGKYRAWSFRGEGAGIARRFLRVEGDCSIVPEAIRQRVSFEQLNLAQDVYPSFTTGTWGMDLILCRNVLIYFDRATIRDVANRLLASLAEGGWLITASTDPPLRDEAPFEIVMTEYGIFYRRGAPSVSYSMPVKSILPARVEPAPLPEKPVSHAPIMTKSIEDPLAAARAALTKGHYAHAAELALPYADDPKASALQIRALANQNAALAEQACVKSVARHPLSSELHYLWAILLLGLGRDDEATQAVRHVIYLDRSLAIGHFLLGTILSRRGERTAAWRCFRNARDLCAARPSDEIVPLSDDEPAGRLAESARVQMTRLDTLSGIRR